MIINNDYVFHARVIEHGYSIYDIIKDYPYCSSIAQNGTNDNYTVTVAYYEKDSTGTWISYTDTYYRADQYLMVTILGDSKEV